MGYIFLSLAIVGELIGTTCMKYSNGFKNIHLAAGTLISYSICFFFFSKALQTLNLGLAYALWSGTGIIAATIISFFLFKEHINFIGILGIILVISGLYLLNFYGTK